MSITNSMAGSQNAIKPLTATALSQPDQASSKQSLQTFAEAAVTPLAPPLTDSGSTASSTTSTVLSTTVIDQNLLQIRQVVVLRAKEQCTVDFQSGDYTRPAVQLSTTLSAIAQSLAISHPEFYHHG